MKTHRPIASRGDLHVGPRRSTFHEYRTFLIRSWRSTAYQARFLRLSLVVLCGCLSNLPLTEQSVDAGEIVSDGGPVQDASAVDAPTGMDDLEVGIMINDDPSITHGFATVRPGTFVTFGGVVTCPKDVICAYRWDFGSGEIVEEKDAGMIEFPNPGFFTVVFSVFIDDELVAGAFGMVTVWEGSFSDDFERDELNFERFGWLRPFFGDFEYLISAGRLTATHEHEQIGATAILAVPLVENFRAEVTLGRHQDDATNYVSSVILRVSPGSAQSSFYNVRVRQGAANQNSLLELSVFKITSEDDHVGVLLNDPSQDPNGDPAPTEPFETPSLANFDEDRDVDIRVVVEMSENEFRITLTDAGDPANTLLTQTFTDTTPTPLLYPGFVGVSHVNDTGFFDDFLLSSLD